MNREFSVYPKINFLLALIGTLGSLYFSEVMKFPPCVLCWYQRICLYPLVFIFGAAVLTEDPGYKKYALPITLTGLAIAAYHNLLYIGVISEGLAPCTKDLSCTSKQLELFGFITIPLLALLGFTSILTLILLDKKRIKEFYEK